MIGERVACWILEGILELLLLSMEKGDGLRRESEDCHFGGLLERCYCSSSFEVERKTCQKLM